ncbi:hypothetical protein ACLOJK_013978 [Asimina triloba]
MARDRISSLPDDILCHILYFLPLKPAARTSILSKRWKTLWTYVRALDFGSESDLPTTPKSSIPIIERCLDLHKSKTVEKFQIHFCPGPKHSPLLNKWIRFAVDKNVQELHLELATGGEEDGDGDDDFGYALPSFLFRSQSITVLKLHCCVLNPSLKSFTGLKHLKTLNLVQVRVGDKALSRILSKCVFLETLCIWACHRLRNPKIRGADLKLRKLLVLGCRGLCSMEISAPNLVLFEYDANNFPKFNFKDVGSLKEVGLFLTDPGHMRVLEGWRKFLADISHVVVLNVGGWLLQFVFAEYFVFESAPLVFKNLKELHFYSSSLTPSMVVSLLGVLGGCPSLVKVDINVEYDCAIQPLDGFDEFEDYEWKPPFSSEFEVDEESLSSVEEAVKYVGFVHHRVHALEMIKLSGFPRSRCLLMLLRFILERTSALETFLWEIHAEKDRPAVEKCLSGLHVNTLCDRVEILEPSSAGVRHLRMFKHVMAC